MYDLTGYMKIGGKDAWTEYSAFLCEDTQEGNTNFNELLRPPEMKEYTAVDFRERNGEELPETLPAPCYKARDLTLYIAVYASSLPECETKRLTLLRTLMQGWVTLRFKGLAAEYNVYYKSATEADILTDALDGTAIAKWKVKFREPKPGPF